MIPDIGGPLNGHLRVSNRGQWHKDFQAWVRSPHDLDNMNEEKDEEIESFVSVAQPNGQGQRVARRFQHGFIRPPPTCGTPTCERGRHQRPFCLNVE